MSALLYILLGALAWHFFKRQIVTAAAWLAFLAACYALLRAAPMLGVPPTWLTTFYGAALLGFLAGGILALRPIVNFLVRRDLARAIERERGNADKRLV